MLRRSQIYAAVGIAAVVWAVVLLVQGVALQPSYLKPYSLAVAAVVICFEIFDRWLWRVGPLPTWIGCPALRGSWKGTLRSTWVDPKTGEETEPREVYLVVRQTYSSVATRLLTAESASTSLVCSLDTASGVTTIQWTYRNTPRLLIQDRSRIHHGAALLDVHGSPPRRLSGFYWTDRDTKGELLFDGHTHELHSDFEAASGGAYK
jgi:SMODS-associating 2TM, beta-strand rich effector domain